MPAVSKTSMGNPKVTDRTGKAGWAGRKPEVVELPGRTGLERAGHGEVGAVVQPHEQMCCRSTRVVKFLEVVRPTVQVRLDCCQSVVAAGGDPAAHGQPMDVVGGAMCGTQFRGPLGVLDTVPDELAGGFANRWRGRRYVRRLEAPEIFDLVVFQFFQCHDDSFLEAFHVAVMGGSEPARPPLLPRVRVPNGRLNLYDKPGIICDFTPVMLRIGGSEPIPENLHRVFVTINEIKLEDRGVGGHTDWLRSYLSALDVA